MTDTDEHVRLFTPEQANAMLPLVRAIAKDVDQLARDVADRRGRLKHLMQGRELNQDDPYSEELLQMQRDLQRDSDQLQAYVDELRQLGVEPKPGGLVDFPSLLDGRVVYLCWKLDEPEVMHWHELNAGFAGRQPLPVGAVPQDDDGSA